jgi:hypothetical protein
MVENGVTTNFTYDANGNMTQKTRGIEWWKYYYDYENRLIKVEYFDGSQTTVLGEYYYDGDGKRIKKVEASQTTIYIYLGWNIIFKKESSTMMETKCIFKIDYGCHVGEVVGGFVSGGVVVEGGFEVIGSVIIVRPRVIVVGAGVFIA